MAKVLLVEDDPLHAFLLRSNLERIFAHVERVTDASEALCLLEQQSFAASIDLVVCSLRMPGFGGSAFATELHDRLPHMPILVLGEPADAAEACFGGCVALLTSPFAADEMLTLAGRLMMHEERAIA